LLEGEENPARRVVIQRLLQEELRQDKAIASGHAVSDD
jgi:hypothetical protein